MKSAQTPNLPTAGKEYVQLPEHLFRRTAEQYMADLHGDIVDLQNQDSKPASLALRRHQFLLMGA